MPRLTRTQNALLRLLIVVLLIGAFAVPLDVARSVDDEQANIDQVQGFAPDTWPSHDWRSPGFVGVVDGQLVDPDCFPMQSVGANVPNLIYRESIVQNLEWMRKNKVRWIRVFATGHAQPTGVSTDAAGRMVRELTRLVEAYNQSVGRGEAIYLLIVLTDYYGQGVSGDVYVRDNAQGCDFRVLPAPWYRRGFQRFNFNPECGDDPVSDAPNYEVNYKPWVMGLVADLADSPAILGWQLGNELKARNSARNGISEGYDWYVDWVRDMTDAIRSVDKNHLVFVGAQYFAELTDVGHRPGQGGIDPELRAKYLQTVDQMARACGAHCWNVWNLTFYDFNHYAIDDAMVLRRGGIGSVAGELGFTLGSPEENVRYFGGDRARAIRSGMAKSWQDVFGEWHDAHWGVADAIRELKLVGAAPWGSPYPNPDTDLSTDLDRARGISLAPEGMSLWHEWTSVAQELEYASVRSGSSAACLTVSSSGRPAGGPPAPRATPLPALLAKPAPSPAPPIDVVGTVTGISTIDSEPVIVVRAQRGQLRLRLPRNQVVRSINLGDTVRVRGWPMGDDVMLAMSIEAVGAAR